MSQKEATVNHIHMYEVSEVPNYETYKQYWGFLVSEPRKYLGTHVLIWAAALLFYVVTAFKAPVGLLVLTIILNILV
jgi:hypothetical protein